MALDRSPQSVRAVLLDIDGTLVDSNGAHAEAWSRAAREAGYERDTEFFRPLIGMGGDRILPLVDPDLDAEASPGREIARRRAEIFEADYLPALRATPGARALVEHLHERGIPCVTASSASAKELQALLAVAEVESLITATTTADDATSTKPAPDIVGTALEKAGCAPERAVLIGDTPYDIESAARAGVETVALRCGGWDDEGLAGAVEIFDDPAALLARLQASPTFPTRGVHS